MRQTHDRFEFLCSILELPGCSVFFKELSQILTRLCLYVVDISSSEG